MMVMWPKHVVELIVSVSDTRIVWRKQWSSATSLDILYVFSDRNNNAICPEEKWLSLRTVAEPKFTFTENPF
jgi:hypothetical protein